MFYMQFLFSGTSLAGQSLLDIGAGTGLASFYAASVGAARVVCLEPEAAGARAGVATTFLRLRRALDLEQVQLLPVTIQDYNPEQDPFDVVLMNNSVNHLDEAACMRLPHDVGARAAYRLIFRKIAAVCHPGSRLIVTDCSPRNFLAETLGWNPLAPDIEWDKHQPPSVWAKVLLESGFARPAVSWTSPTRLGPVGRLFLGNKLAAYLLTSHFRLLMDRSYEVG